MRCVVRRSVCAVAQHGLCNAGHTRHCNTMVRRSVHAVSHHHAAAQHPRGNAPSRYGIREFTMWEAVLYGGKPVPGDPSRIVKLRPAI